MAFVKKSENFDNVTFFVEKKRKKCNSLSFAIKEINLRPELSSPPRFRIQGGVL